MLVCGCRFVQSSIYKWLRPKTLIATNKILSGKDAFKCACKTSTTSEEYILHPEKKHLQDYQQVI